MRVLLILLTLLVFACAEPRGTGAPPLPPIAADHLGRAQILLEEGEYRAALDRVEQARTVAPQAAEVAFMEGRIRFEQGLLDEAEAAYARAASLNPELPGLAHNRGNVAFLAREYRTALDFYREAARRAGEARNWHAVGGAYEELGIADSARTAYERAAKLDADNAAIQASLAALLEVNGRPEEALVHARRAADLAPSNPLYVRKRAELLVAVGQASEALPDLNRLVADRPWDYTAQFARGRALRILGRGAEADAALARADSVRGRMAEVERLEQNARDLAGSVENQVAYAEALREVGRLDESIAAYERARALRPDVVSLTTNLATLHLQAGRPAVAEALYRDVIEQAPENLEAWLNLSILRGRQGDEAGARRAWERAAELAPDHPMVRRLAEAFAG